MGIAIISIVLLLPLIIELIDIIVSWYKRISFKKNFKNQIAQSEIWDIKSINETVKKSYFALQKAWSNMDLDQANEYLTAELKASWNEKLDTLRQQNEKMY